MKFKARVEYHAVVTVEIEADDEKHAEKLAVEEADDYIDGNISVYDIKLTPL